MSRERPEPDEAALSAAVVLEEGKRLFENCVPPRGLTLVETRSTPGGVLVNTYHPAGPLPRGRA